MYGCYRVPTRPCCLLHREQFLSFYLRYTLHVYLPATFDFSCVASYYYSRRSSLLARDISMVSSTKPVRKFLPHYTSMRIIILYLHVTWWFTPVCTCVKLPSAALVVTFYYVCISCTCIASSPCTSKVLVL